MRIEITEAKIGRSTKKWANLTAGTSSSGPHHH
jgi:hypothetical protein